MYTELRVSGFQVTNLILFAQYIVSRTSRKLCKVLQKWSELLNK